MTLSGSEPSRDPELQARPTGRGAVQLTDQQLFRVEKLSELGATGPVLGELYVRAVELVEQCDSPSGMSLLAHAIRELLNRLPAVLGFSFEDFRGDQSRGLSELEREWPLGLNPDDLPTPDADGAIAVPLEIVAQIQRVIRASTLARGENLKKSLVLATRSAAVSAKAAKASGAAREVSRLHEFFMDYAHIGDPPKKLPDASVTKTNFVQLERILDLNLKQFWAGNAAVKASLERANTLSKTGAWLAPTDADIEEVVVLLEHPQNAYVFYGGLTNPLWLPALYDGRFLHEPEPPEPAPTGGVYAVAWPEGDYIARVAADQPDVATRFLKDLDTKENVTTEAHLLSAAVALPAKFAAQLVPTVVRCLRNGNHMLNPVRLSELLRHLATPSTEKALKRLAAAIFNPPGAIDDYWYKSELPAAAITLHAALGIDAIGILAGWLFDASKLDGAGFWRSSIADHPQNSDFGIGSSLVDAMRDVALTHVRNEPASLPKVVARLRTPATRSEISDRIALHVLATAVREGLAGAQALAEKSLLDPAYLDYPFVLEYGELGTAVLLGAAPEVEDRWMDLVEHDTSPSEDDVRGILSYFDKRDPASVRDEEISLYRARKVRDRMVLVESSLPERLLSHLRVLDEEVGARDPHTGFAVWSESFVGPVSPASSDDLTDMSPDEVIEYLLDWVPPVGEMFGPSREGLGRQLAMMVEANPSSMTSVTQRIPKLHSSYVRSILDGWTNAVKNGVLEFHWDAILPVVDFVTRQPDEGDVRGTGDEDTGWRASHKSAISLLRAGMLAPEALRIPIAHRDTVWLNIERISDSSDPTPSRESNDGMDMMSLALNAVRCDAIDATVVYISWLQSAGLPVNAIGADAGGAEAWAVLDRHLEPAVDPSRAVRVIYGQAFPYLAHVSPDWAAANAERVLGLGEDEVESRLRDAGWTAFVTRRDPSNAMLALLGNIYLGRLRQPSLPVPKSEVGQSSGDRIALHVLTLYAWGVIDIDSADQLVRTFFEHAAVEVRSKALGHLGWWLNQLGDTTPPDMVERLQRLWESRREVVDAGASAAELVEVGWWLRCRQFPDGWIVERVAHVVATGTALERPGLVAEDLEYLARGFPGECLTVLEGILAASTGWELSLVGQHAAPAIAAGLDSDDDTIRHRANDLLSSLGESGALTLYDEVQALREQP